MPVKTSAQFRLRQSEEDGFALIMVVIFSVLLFVLVADLVTSAQMAHSTGRNDALLVRMENHMRLTLLEVEQSLKDDLEGGDAAGLGGDPLAGAMGASGAGGEGAGGGAGGAPGEGEAEEAPPSDSRNDSWYKPMPYSDGDLTTYAWVEDENRKFNILSLGSPDEEYAEVSKDRLVRLILSMRENTLFEITNSDATTIADEIQDWINGMNRNEVNRPLPQLKSDNEVGDRKTIPLHLDELLLLRGVDETVFYDLAYAGPPVQVLPGLESVLTIYTSYRTDPGDPQKAANNANAAGGNNSEGSGGGAGGGEPGPAATEGIGVRININTAPRPVLRCLFTSTQLPDSVLDAILAYRNEDAPEEEEGGEGSAAGEGQDVTDYAGDVMEGEETLKQIFVAVEDLEEVPEYASLDPDIKDQFSMLVTTESDVFSIHLACVFKKNEERKIFVMSRRKSVVIRLEGDEMPRLYPIVRLERRQGIRVLGVDFPELEEEQRRMQEYDMDEFSLEERAWNPFFPEFYDTRRKGSRGR
jgi:competence protein ComGC